MDSPHRPLFAARSAARSSPATSQWLIVVLSHSTAGSSMTSPYGAFRQLFAIAIYHRSCWTISDYCYLQDLFVGARKLGLGRALIEAVYEAARAAGASRVHWLTHETNAVARSLYDTLADRPGLIQYRKLF